MGASVPILEPITLPVILPKIKGREFADDGRSNPSGVLPNQWIQGALGASPGNGLQSSSYGLSITANGTMAHLPITLGDCIVETIPSQSSAWNTIAIRMSSNMQSFYMAGVYSGSGLIIYKCSGGTFTLLAQNASVTFSSGKTLSLQAIGSKLTVIYGAYTLSISDSTFASGYVGIYADNGAKYTYIRGKAL